MTPVHYLEQVRSVSDALCVVQPYPGEVAFLNAGADLIIPMRSIRLIAATRWRELLSGVGLVIPRSRN